MKADSAEPCAMRMERVPTSSDDVLVYRAGNLRLTCIAALACVTGVVLLKVAGTLVRVESTAIGLLGLAAAGLVVGGAIGFVLSLRRSGIVLDRVRGKATAWQSGGVRRRATTRELGAFWAVLLSPGRVQGRYTSRTVYLVGLYGEVGEPLLLQWDSDYQAARRFALEICGFLGFPFTDATGTESITHPPGHATTTARPGQAPALQSVPRPTTLRCRVHWQDATLFIEEPRIGWRERFRGPTAVFLLLAPALLAIGAYARFFGEYSRVLLDPLTASIIVVGMLLLALLAVVASSLPQVAQRRIVEASENGLRFRMEGYFASKDRHLRRADIRELRLAFGHLTAITPRDVRVICGTLHHPLPRAELEWLRDQLSQALHGKAAVETNPEAIEPA
jgi:hypothetical protein